MDPTQQGPMEGKSSSFTSQLIYMLRTNTLFNQQATTNSKTLTSLWHHPEWLIKPRLYWTSFSTNQDQELSLHTSSCCQKGLDHNTYTNCLRLQLPWIQGLTKLEWLFKGWSPFLTDMYSVLLRFCDYCFGISTEPSSCPASPPWQRLYTVKI